jgi:hypothetical protein
MKKLILFLSIICASGLTMVNIYNGVIDAQSWASDIPASIQTARDYFQHVDPRRFYTIVGPVNEIPADDCFVFGRMRSRSAFTLRLRS